MNKIVIVINGKPEAGKDTFCDLIINHYKARKISAITPILKAASGLGWDGVKDNKSRKFLSDLKKACIDFNNLPNNYLLQNYDEFLNSSDEILFVHIRESDQIQMFLDCIKAKGQTAYATLLIKKDNDRKLKFFGNDSDDYVDNFVYDYYFDNDGSIEQSEKKFLEFFEMILKDKEFH
jgi:dephospho-CoA kinase